MTGDCKMSRAQSTLDDADFIAYLKKSSDLTEAAAARVLSASIEAGTSVERSLLELGLVSENILFEALANYLAVPLIDAARFDPALVEKLGLETSFLERVGAFPFQIDDKGGPIHIAMADPRSRDVAAGIGFYLGRDVEVALACPSDIKAALGRLSGVSTSGSGDHSASHQDVARLKALANDGPVIKLVNDLIAQAVQERASDIHIEADEIGARVRFRVDGVLWVKSRIPTTNVAAVVSRLKVLGNLNISERRRPQDGRASIMVRGRSVDIRMSTLPTQHGESVVLRLLDRHRLELDWERLGFPAHRITEIETAIAAPNGLFLVAGPTGSGKTTTLYTALSRISSDDRKIVTVEDPVEYALEGINQTQVQPEIDMTFGSALRAILRQDPDVVMVGEIRDEETAAIAVRAALVGRLVLSTIHTNDAISAIDRLRDLGVPDYLLSSTLRGVLSQRLARRLCPSCNGKGCDNCGELGRKGRIVISEFLKVTSSLSSEIKKGGRASLLEVARQEGYRTLAQNSEEILAGGLASEGDIIRALGADWDALN
ncbi:GspE/PulE family protein [Boseongicola sp. H5]|uniref:GspE/PulE family protein n=1 Tax=Boseongicola sp. H5 TaxID=2763261 RepID=UPI001D0ABF90|nr:GspE/PulE family protein [Boseongicola sp. H5]